MDAQPLKRAVTVDTDGCAIVGDLKARCLDAAVHTGLSAALRTGLDTTWPPMVCLTDPASDRKLADDLPLDDADLADGDLLVLNITSPSP